MSPAKRTARQPGPPGMEADDFDRLRRSVRELSILKDLAVEMARLRDFHQILKVIVETAIKAVAAEQGAIVVLGSQPENTARTLVREAYSSSIRQAYHINEGLVGWMRQNRAPLNLDSPKHDRRFAGELWDPQIHSLLCVPMIFRKELIGVLAVYNQREGEVFSSEDVRFLDILATQSAQILELTRVDEEMWLASQIQNRLLPDVPPRVPGYEMAARSLPARMVGGDSYDFIPVDRNRLVVCLGDVSGKGLPASLLMTHVQGTVRAQAGMDSEPARCVTRLNALLHQSTPPERFVTFFYAILDFQRQLLGYTNAGHHHPLHISKTGRVSRLTVGGPVLGVFESPSFAQAEVSMEPGDVLVLYSDGIPDAVSEAGEMFDEERLVGLLEGASAWSARETVDRVLGAVARHTGAAPQADDTTLVVVKRQEPSHDASNR